MIFLMVYEYGYGSWYAFSESIHYLFIRHSIHHLRANFICGFSFRFISNSVQANKKDCEAFDDDDVDLSSGSDFDEDEDPDQIGVPGKCNRGLTLRIDTTTTFYSVRSFVFFFLQVAARI